MQATDQLSAMGMMAVDPVRRVVVPRFLGGVVAMPLLAAMFSVTAVYGVQLVGVQIMGFDRQSSETAATFAAAKTLDARFVANGAKVGLFETWGFWSGDAASRALWAASETPHGTRWERQ